MLSFVLLAAALSQAVPPEPASTLVQAKLLRQISELERSLDGVLGLTAIDLKSGRRIEYNGNVVFAQASSIKIPILIELFRQSAQGRVDLDRRVTLTKTDLVGGDGPIKDLLSAGPFTVSIRELAERMIVDSDNTATNWIIRLLGMAAVNQSMDRLGLPAIRLQRVMMDSQAAATGMENIATPNSMAALMTRLYRGRAVNREADAQILEILGRVKADFRAALPAETRVAAKPGAIPGIRCETGIVYLENRPFALSIMTAFLADDKRTVLREAALAVHNHFKVLSDFNAFGHKTGTSVQSQSWNSPAGGSPSLSTTSTRNSRPGIRTTGSSKRVPKSSSSAPAQTPPISARPATP